MYNNELEDEQIKRRKRMMVQNVCFSYLKNFILVINFRRKFIAKIIIIVIITNHVYQTFELYFPILQRKNLFKFQVLFVDSEI